MEPTIAMIIVLAGSLSLFAVSAQAGYEQGRASASAIFITDRGSGFSKGRSKGEVSFEVLRMLSTGMTKAEVLTRAGRPRYMLRHGRLRQWVYSSTDNWIVEINFNDDRVIGINWARP